MHAVLFHVGDDRYALDARSVAEVVPAIPLRPVPGTPEHIPGVFDYRGVVVPVVDLSRRLSDVACPRRLSTRIIVCNAEGRVAREHGAHEATTLVGLLAEQVLRVAEIDESVEGSHPGPSTTHGKTLGRILHDGEALLQAVTVEDLLPPDVLREVARRGSVEAEGA